MFSARTSGLMRRLCVVGLLLACLAFFARPTVSQSCVDSDQDGTTTCDGDCNDQDPNRDLRDFDGDGVTTCAYDCDDFDPAVNNCGQQFRVEPDYTYYPETCGYTYMRYIRRYCPWGSGPPPSGHSFNDCTILSVVDYLVEDTCSP